MHNQVFSKVVFFVFGELTPKFISSCTNVNPSSGLYRSNINIFLSLFSERLRPT